MKIGLFSDTYPPEINGVANSTYILKNELENVENIETLLNPLILF